MTNGALYTQGGAFTLTNDVNFGASFGLVSSYFKSRTAAIANTGVLRLANTDTVVWAGTGAQGDIGLSVNTANYLISNAAGVQTGNVVVTGDVIINGTGGYALTINKVGSASLQLTSTGTNTGPQISFTGNNGQAYVGIDSFYSNVFAVGTGAASILSDILFMTQGHQYLYLSNANSSITYGNATDKPTHNFAGGILVNQATIYGSLASFPLQINGSVIVSAQGNTQILLNALGTNWGVIGTPGNGVWGVGYVPVPGQAPSYTLQWTSTGNVSVANISTANAHRDGYVNVGTVTSTVNINCGAGAYQDITLAATGMNVFFQNTSPAGTVTTLTLLVRQSANGSNTLNWGNTIRWSDNNVPVLSTTQNTMDAFTFTTYDGGTIWIGGQIYGNVPLANIY